MTPYEPLPGNTRSNKSLHYTGQHAKAQAYSQNKKSARQFNQLDGSHFLSLFMCIQLTHFHILTASLHPIFEEASTSSFQYTGIGKLKRYTTLVFRIFNREIIRKMRYYLLMVEVCGLFWGNWNEVGIDMFSSLDVVIRHFPYFW